MRLLCTSDLHLGRRSSRFADRVPADALSAIDVWRRIVLAAIEHRVDIVALGGDVVDQDNRYFMADGPLTEGIRSLYEHGIVTVAVAGNHDFDVLPALATTLSARLPAGAFHFLGTGGVWQRVPITTSHGEHLYVDGWSFPTRHVTTSPLDSYTLPPVHDAPVLGLLHTDRDVVGSVYAPTATVALQAAPVGLWCIGHIHIPAVVQEHGAVILNPGSPQPFRPTETGVHGAWLVELPQGGAPSLRMLPLAAARYDSVTVSLEGIESIDGARQAIGHAVHAHIDDCLAVASMNGQRTALRALGLRLFLTGRTAVHRDLQEELVRLLEDATYDRSELIVHIERVDTALRPPLDLAQLATVRDARGWLARVILAARSTPGEQDANIPESLWKTARAAANSTIDAKPFTDLPREHRIIDDAQLRMMVAMQAERLLDTLVAQRGEAA
jgi:DNA repair exonuclease SbcCD nuclease subunit